MDLSIIIPTFKRHELLDYGLKSLSKQKISSPFEVIVLNDGVQDRTQLICSKYADRLPIRYVFTGQRNEQGELKWRIPAYCINIGAKLAQGKNILIECPEMYIINDCVQSMIDLVNGDDRRLVITEGKDDRGALFLHYVKMNYDHENLSKLFDNGTRNLHPLNTEYPFFLMMNRKRFIDIGGYDEDFGEGYCWDDLDIVTRLKKTGCYYHKVNVKVVHLYHPRLRYGNDDIKSGWKRNEKMFYDRINQIERNVNKEWGVIDVQNNIS